LTGTPDLMAIAGRHFEDFVSLPGRRSHE
jgi:hypothetical protein